MVKNKNDIEIKIGEDYWTPSIVYLPVKVNIIDIDNNKVKIMVDEENERWIDIDRLFDSEENCPKR